MEITEVRRDLWRSLNQHPAQGEAGLKLGPALEVNLVTPGLVLAGSDYLQNGHHPIWVFFCSTPNCEAFSFHLMRLFRCFSCYPHASPSRVLVHPFYTLQTGALLDLPEFPMSVFLRQSQFVWCCKYSLTIWYLVFPSHP